MKITIKYRKFFGKYYISPQFAIGNLINTIKINTNEKIKPIKTQIKRRDY